MPRIRPVEFSERKSLTMSEPIKHIVQPGETLFGIADKNGVSHAAIKAANPQIPDIDKILPGDVVFIPVQGPEDNENGGNGASSGVVSGSAISPTAPFRGLDASVPLTKIAACLKENGFGFAIRYYSAKPRKKNLTLTEAQALVKAGLLLGVVFEETARRSLSGRAQGVSDAKTAHAMAVNEIGQPPNTPIYFAVDFDAKPSEMPKVIAYFEGVRDGLAQANGGTARYGVGVYGSGLTCTELLKRELVTFTWLIESTGFLGSKDFARQKLYNLIQIFVPPDGQPVCKVVVDPDEMNPDPVTFPPGLFTV